MNDPAKHDLERAKIEPAMSHFRSTAERARRIDGIDLTLPFLERAVLLLAHPATAFGSR